MRIAYPNGETIIDYPLLEQNVVSHLADKIIVDGGAIKIDSANHSLDEAHLVLDGILTAGQNYFKIIKSGETLCNVDYTGKLFANQNVSSPNITTIESNITSLQTATSQNTTTLQNSTHEDTHGTLVVRNDNGTLFNQITANVVNISDDLAIYGDGAVTFTPQDQNGNNILGYTYRLGNNIEEPGDFTGIGDGLEFKQPAHHVTYGVGNEILVQVNELTPTIEILSNKTSDTIPCVLVRAPDNKKVVSIDIEGLHVHPTELSITYLTPGQHFDSVMLLDGYQVHRFQLSVGWEGSIPETTLEFRGESTQDSGEFRTVQNLEVCLDDLSQPFATADVMSRVYIKRWGVYRNTHSRVWIVLGVDYRDSETIISQGTYLRVSFNFNRILEDT